jgi:hypothetical protein
MKAFRRRTADERRKPATVDEYLSRLPADQRAALRRLRRIIRAPSPRMEEAVSYGMPVFRLDGRWVVCGEDGGKADEAFGGISMTNLAER